MSGRSRGGRRVPARVLAAVLLALCAARGAALAQQADAGRAETHLHLAKAYLKLNQFAEAEASLRRYAEARPEAEDGAYLLAYALFRQGRARESLAAYERAGRVAPAAADDLKVIGLNFGLLGDYDRSAEYLGKALALDAENLEARYYLGRVYSTQNRFREAAREFRAVLARDPRHAKAQNNLGQALEGQNEIDGAIAAYRRAIALEGAAAPPSDLPWLNPGARLRQRDAGGEAIELLGRAAALNPSSALARFQLGKAHLRAGQLEAAERELRAATEIDPQDKGARYQLGRLYHRLGKTELARRELEISERLSAGPKR